MEDGNVGSETTYEFWRTPLFIKKEKGDRPLYEEVKCHE
jgi:hypothetical protein